mgnify:CR=1 FL=1
MQTLRATINKKALTKTMPTMRLTLLSVTMLLALRVAAADYPTKPVRMENDATLAAMACRAPAAGSRIS